MNYYDYFVTNQQTHTLLCHCLWNIMEMSSLQLVQSKMNALRFQNEARKVGPKFATHFAIK